MLLNIYKFKGDLPSDFAKQIFERFENKRLPVHFASEIFLEVRKLSKQHNIDTEATDNMVTIQIEYGA